KGYTETTAAAPTPPAAAAPPAPAVTPAPQQAGTRTFVFQDGKSLKFWNIELQGNRFTVTFGKVGTKGQTQTKEFADAAKAQKEYDNLVKEKLSKGYAETTAAAPPAAPVSPPAPAVSPAQRALEQALVENPDDLAAHGAYADYLMEQGDPRGEFIQV